MKVTVNGRPEELAPGTPVAEVVAGLTGQASGVAVAVNATVIPRSAWESTRLSPGDRVEVLTAVQGG